MGDRPIRVLLNASALPRQPAGAGVYTLELAKALAAREDVALTVASPRELPGIKTRPSPQGGPPARAVWEQLSLPRVARASGAEVLHGAHMATPLRAGIPTVATIHDLTFLRLPRRYTRAHRIYYRALARTARRADRIIVPSKAVAGDVVHYLNYAPERIRVVHEAPRDGLGPAPPKDVGYARDRLQIDWPYILCLGTAEPGKRAVDAIRALAELRGRGVRVGLVLAGNPGRLSEPLLRETARLGLGDRVARAGYVADSELAALITGATALVFPSLYEGFGLPPLEAMACGTPVIASRAPAMTEVLGDAAIFVPLRDPRSIAAEAERLLTDDGWRSEWRARGLEQARRYSWARAAAETVSVYCQLVAS